MLDQVTELFAPDRKKPATSTQIEKALEDVKTEVVRKREELATLTQQQAAILLTGDEKAVDTHERKLQLTNRDITRFAIVQGQLAEELGKARDREAKSDEDKLIRAAHRDHDRGVKLIEQLAEPARQCVELLTELKEIEERIHRARREAERFGRRDEIPGSPNQTVRPRQRHLLTTFCIPRLTADAPYYAPGTLVHSSDVMRWERPREPPKPSKKKRRPVVSNAEGQDVEGQRYHLPPRGYRHVINRGIDV